MAKTNFTVSITQSRQSLYPNACPILEERGSNISDLLLKSLELFIRGNGLQGKTRDYVEWALMGKTIEMGKEGEDDEC